MFPVAAGKIKDRGEKGFRMLPLNLDYEEMLTVLDEGRIRQIIETRRNLETRLRIPHWQNYKICIDYEMTVISELKVAVKLREAEFVLQKVFYRIQGLFLQSIEILHRPSICHEYFDFCEKERYTHGIADLITFIMRQHEKFPFSEDTIFIRAADIYWAVNYDLESCINVLKDGLKLHPQSEALYIKCMEFEIFHKEKKCDTIEVTEIVMAYIRNMMKNITEPAAYINTVHWFQDFNNTLPLQNYLIDFLVKEHNDDANVWELLIERERKGYPLGSLAETATEHERILKCIDKYEQGLKLLRGDNEKNLLDNYLDFLFGLRNDEKFKDKFSETMQIGSRRGILSEKYYIIWLEMSTWGEKRDIFSVATKTIPMSLELWRMWLKYEICNENKKEVMKVFNLGREVLSPIADQFPLSNIVQFWLMMLNFHMLMSNKDEVREFFETAVLEGANVSNIFKAKFLEWLVVKEGVDISKKVYTELWKKMPSKEMYNSMCQLQGIEVEKAVMVWWDEIHVEACKVYGKEDVDVWINYIKFFMCYNKDGTQKIEEIKNKAKENLPHIKHKHFVESYELLLKNICM